MGYGIKILSIQRAYLPCILKGNQDKSGFADIVKQSCYDIHKVSNDLCRLSGWTINFIGECKTLFNICEIDADDEGDFWDNIYVWKNSYCKMEWCELKVVVEPLIDEFINKMDYKLNETEAGEIIYTLERLFSIVEISRTFKIC